MRRKDEKGRVLKDGESYRADGRYMYRYNSPDGKRHSIYSKSLNDLRNEEKRIQRDLDDGINYALQTKTLNQQFDILMSTKTNLRITTRDNYISVWNSMVRNTQIGNSEIKDIKKSNVLLFYANLVEKGYKKRTIGYIHRLVYQTFEMACEDDILRKNPSNGCGKLYSTAESERIALSLKQQDVFLAYVKDNVDYKKHLTLIVFLLGTGCRFGETSGLTWDCVDFKKNEIIISKQLVHKSINGKMQFMINTPKTKSGLRTIPMSPQVKEQLSIQKTSKMFLSISSGINIDGTSGFVFVTGKGHPIQPHSFFLTLRRICRDIREKNIDAEFPDISAHIFRHTACTRMAEKGMDIKVLMTIMGHSDVDMITRVYNHVDTARSSLEMKRIGDIVGL